MEQQGEKALGWWKACENPGTTAWGGVEVDVSYMYGMYSMGKILSSPLLEGPRDMSTQLDAVTS